MISFDLEFAFFVLFCGEMTDGKVQLAISGLK